jgi:hypothetical protein
MTISRMLDAAHRSDNGDQCGCRRCRPSRSEITERRQAWRSKENREWLKTEEVAG